MSDLSWVMSLAGSILTLALLWQAFRRGGEPEAYRRREGIGELFQQGNPAKVKSVPIRPGIARVLRTRAQGAGLRSSSQRAGLTPVEIPSSKRGET